MSDVLPFFLLDDSQLREELYEEDGKHNVFNRLSDQGLKDFVYKISKNDYFKSLRFNLFNTRVF